MQDYFQILNTKDKHMLKILVVAIVTLQPPPNFGILGLLKDQILCEKTSVLVGTKLNMVGTPTTKGNSQRFNLSDWKTLEQNQYFPEIMFKDSSAQQNTFLNFGSFFLYL